MNCSEINNIENCTEATYHCLVDAVNKTMVEVCTVPRNLNGRCPLFYRKHPFVRNDYNRDCNADKTCPPFYSSTDAYKYQDCYNISQLSTTKAPSEPMPSVITHKSTITVQPPTIPKSKTASQNKEEEENNNTLKVIIPILLIVVIYFIVVILLKVWKGFPWCEALCFPWFAIKKCQDARNPAVLTNGIDNLQNHERDPMLQPTDTEERRTEVNELNYFDQSQDNNGIALMCSEESESYPGVTPKPSTSEGLPLSTLEVDLTEGEDEQTDGLEPSVDLRQNPGQLLDQDEIPPPCVNEPCTRMKKTKRGITVTGGGHMQKQDHSKERNVETLVKGIDKTDKRIFDLLKQQYNVKGCIKYLEIKLTCIIPLIREFEKDFCGTPFKPSTENANGESLIERINFLESAYSCILKEIEKLEPKFGLQAELSTETSPEASTSGGETASDGACGYDFQSRAKKLESTLLQIDERLNKLYVKGYGKEGQLKSCLAKLQGLECALDQLETEYQLPVNRFEVPDVGLMAMADQAPERLEKLFERLENLDLQILK